VGAARVWVKARRRRRPSPDRAVAGSGEAVIATVDRRADHCRRVGRDAAVDFAKRALVVVAVALGAGAFLYWGFAFAYSDWLRFGSPLTPDPGTGQVFPMKAVKGVFYVTEQQHRWLETALLPVWFIGAACMVVLKVLKPEKMIWRPWVSNLARAVGVIAWLSFLALFAFGDQVMALIFTGSLSLPAGPGRDLFSPLNLLPVVGAGIVLVVVASKWWMKSKRGSTQV
jgi:hypothetical protein